MEKTKPERIVEPPDFPVRWQHPHDVDLLWMQDRLHCPDAMTPLDFSFMTMVDDGINQAAREYEIPVMIHDRHINTYLYMAVVRPDSVADHPAAPVPHSDEKVQAVTSSLGTLWEHTWLPEVQSHLACWADCFPADADSPALLEQLAEIERRFRRVWKIHFLLFIPMLYAIHQFEEFYRELFPDAGTFDPYDLLAGFDNKTLDNGRRQWELSRKVLNSPTLLALFRATSAAEVILQLPASAEGREFLTALHDYLSLHGQRSDKITMNTPSWVEDPTPVIKSVQNFIAQPARNLPVEFQAIADRRELRLQAVRTRMKDYPRPVATQFEELLAAAQTATILKEDHTYWLDCKVVCHMRRVLLEMGRRLATAAVIDAPGDVFYLYLEELRQALKGLPAGADWRSLVTERQADERRYATQIPPALLGTMVGEPPTADLLSRLLLKVEGTAVPAAETAGEIRGNPGSPGFARGAAKVVRTLADAGKLESGDILVAETTASSWTPFFPTLGAVVTDSGGVLCHGAVVAREYGIPAVVGAGNATTTIRDGQRLEVDGNTGRVRVLSA